MMSDMERRARGEGREVESCSDKSATGLGWRSVETSVRRRWNDSFVGGSDI